MEFSTEQHQRQFEFREFVDQVIIPYSHKHDLDERIHPEVLQRLMASGYLGANLPEKYGGLGADNITLGILNEEMGRGCSSVRSLFTVHGMVALSILKWGTENQRQEWLPRMAAGEVLGAFGLTEPNAGSDAKSIETTALLDGDEYILNGKKKWITIGQIANVFLVFAKVEGKPTAFLVERNQAGLFIEPMFGLLGARASMIAELTFDNCRIPKKCLLGQIGAGLSHIALQCLDYGRYTIACGCVGLAQACLEQSISYSNSRIQFGKPIRENQLIQKMITEMVVNRKAARLLCYKAGYLRDKGDPDSIIETWVAKYYASTTVNKIASDAIQIHGANGCYRDYPIERFYRDARINEIIEGTTQIHEALIATQEFMSDKYAF
ncbi:acyl-CoA dehydrogenase family protein [Paenibacillus alvei]|uniref:acyl-CoA dehydrogenase family protein n=1 Tax=Paenibacillus alvei TaxID=44250 RepID=UPI001F2A7AEF|nr:acyl-CoA dehydrogenase family protein [Paenibacillus alvei]